MYTYIFLCSISKPLYVHIGPSPLTPIIWEFFKYALRSIFVIFGACVLCLLYRCEYVRRLGVFKNNEHVIVTTAIDLTKAFFGGAEEGRPEAESWP